MTSPVCRLCGAPDFTDVLTMANSPRFIARLLSPQELGHDKPISVQVFQCRRCDHVQILNEMENSYYDDYVMGLSGTPKILNFQREQGRRFVEEFGLEGKHVFEAGCGEGLFSNVLMDFGCHVSACEPSTSYARLAREKGVTILGKYVKENTLSNYHQSFDAFATRQVLEHVPDPNDFIRECRNMLRPGGVGLVEVPSLEQAIEHGRFFDFFPDHLSYFSETSLRHLFSRNHLDVIRIMRTMDGEYLEAWVRRTERPNLAAVKTAASEIGKAFEEFMVKESQAGRRVAVWGAGGKGVVVLSQIDTQNISYLIDNDPVKHGRFTPASHLPVAGPRRLLEEPVETIVITALAFLDEIVDALRTTYEFHGKIVFLEGEKIQEI